jgi:hypothetical protein
MARKRSISVGSVGEVLSWIKRQKPDELWLRGQPRTWVPEPALLRNSVSRGLRECEGRRWAQLWGPQYAAKNYEESDPRLLISAERRLNYEFVRETRSLLALPASNVETYFLAQHHRLPTRLLDWSTRPLTALFFAVVDEYGEHSIEDGILYALNPVYPIQIMLDRPSRGGDPTDLRTTHGPFTPADELLAGLIEQSFRGEAWNFNLTQTEATETDGDGVRSALAEVDTPIPVAPNLEAGRMFAQGSCFTLHPFRCPQFQSKVLKSAVIPACKKGEIRNELRRLGVTYTALFPEPDSAVRDIRARWSI